MVRSKRFSVLALSALLALLLFAVTSAPALADAPNPTDPPPPDNPPPGEDSNVSAAVQFGYVNPAIGIFLFASV